MTPVLPSVQIRLISPISVLSFQTLCLRAFVAIDHHESTPSIEIEDTGIGIPPEQIEKIFLPFEQLKNFRNYTEGTGPGLAISQQLIHMMGSELFVNSTIDKGSLFWFDLELPEVAYQPIVAPVLSGVEGSESANEARQSRPIVGFQGDIRKILIVDDNKSNWEMLRDLLAPVGFDILEAAGGQKAIDKARESHPDLIFMAIMMPGMGGLEATKRITFNNPVWIACW